MSELSDYEAVEYLEGLREDLKNDVISVYLAIQDEDLQALDRAIKRLGTEIKTVRVSHDFELHEIDNAEKCINKMYELFISKLLEEQLLEIKKCELRPEHKARIIYEVKVVKEE